MRDHLARSQRAPWISQRAKLQGEPQPIFWSAALFNVFQIVVAQCVVLQQRQIVRRQIEQHRSLMLATFLSGIAEFERDLISERVKSGLAAAKARGKRLGRQTGQRPKSDRLASKVIALSAEGRSYRWIARDLGISKNTVADIVIRGRLSSAPKTETTS